MSREEDQKIGHNWAHAPSTDAMQIEEEYDQTAQDYDAHLDANDFRAPADAAQIFTEFVSQDALVLDAGCGTGRTGAVLAKRGYTNIVGVDISQKMLDIAARKQIYKSLHKGNLITDLPFEEGKFDAIFCVGVLSHINDPRVFSEMRRCVRPGGILLFTQRDDLFIKFGYETILRSIDMPGQWEHVYTSEPMPYMPKNPDYGDRIKGLHYVYRAR